MRVPDYSDELTCIGCRQTLPLTAFVALAGQPRRFYTRCKLCRARREFERRHPGLSRTEWQEWRKRASVKFVFD